MAVGVLINRWTVKPPLGYGIDWSNPITAGLVEVIAFNEYGGSPYSLVVPTNLTQTGTGQTWVNQARSYDGSGGRDQLANRAALQITGAMSLAIGFVSTVATADASFHDVVNKRAAAGSSNIEYGINFRNNAGARQFFWNNGAAFQVVSDTGTAVAPNTTQNWVGTRSSATAGKLYIGGAQVGSTSGLSSAGTSTTAVTFGSAADGSGPWTGLVLYFFLWNRELTAAEVASLNGNPYQMYAPRRSYFNTASGGPFPFYTRRNLSGGMIPMNGAMC